MKKIWMMTFAISLLAACQKEINTDPANSPEAAMTQSNKDKEKENTKTKTKTVSITGSLAGTSIFVPSASCAYGFLNVGHGTGTSTKFGAFSFDNSDCAGTPFNTTFTYPNGDKVYSSQVGEMADPITGYPIQYAVMTGGTGRFAGVTGTSQLIITSFVPTASPGVYSVSGNFSATLTILKDKDDD